MQMWDAAKYTYLSFVERFLVFSIMWDFVVFLHGVIFFWQLEAIDSDFTFNIR